MQPAVGTAISNTHVYILPTSKRVSLGCQRALRVFSLFVPRAMLWDDTVTVRLTDTATDTDTATHAHLYLSLSSSSSSSVFFLGFHLGLLPLFFFAPSASACASARITPNAPHAPV